MEYERDQKNVREMMSKLLQQHAAPDLEIDIFDGIPMDFHYFMAVFKEVVENKVTDPRGQLTRLIKFKKGEAEEIAKNCITEYHYLSCLEVLETNGPGRY